MIPPFLCAVRLPGLPGPVHLHPRPRAQRYEPDRAPGPGNDPESSTPARSSTDLASRSREQDRAGGLHAAGRAGAAAPRGDGKNLRGTWRVRPAALALHAGLSRDSSGRWTRGITCVYVAAIRKGKYYVNKLRKILKAERAKRGMTQAQAGAAINVSGSLIAAIENGRVIPQPGTAAQLDALFGTGEEVQEAAAEARADARPHWLRPWTDQEQRATLLRTWEPLIVPGLLQIEEYARALLQGAWLSDDVIQQTIQVRQDRQAATINRAIPPTLSVIISEFALMCTPSEVRRDQIKHLLDIGNRPKAQVLVVPRSAGLHPGLQGAFVLATLPGRGRAGYVDDQLRGRVVTEAKDLDQLEVTWEIVSGLALPVQPSRDLLQRAINDHD